MNYKHDFNEWASYIFDIEGRDPTDAEIAQFDLGWHDNLADLVDEYKKICLIGSSWYL